MQGSLMEMLGWSMTDLLVFVSFFGLLVFCSMMLVGWKRGWK